MRKIVVGLLPILLAFAIVYTLPVQAVTQADIDASIAKGMAWLATKQNLDGSWGTGWMVGETGFAVVKFETHALHIGIDPLDPSYQYYSQVRNGLDYIFRNAYTVPIGMQTHGDPDVSHDGIGVGFAVTTDVIYETGIAMMAIAASAHPATFVTVPGAVMGWTYKSVLQHAVDYMAWAQTDGGTCEGGWNYDPSDNGTDRSDNSNSGYAVLGLSYAAASTIEGATGFGCTIPAFVKSELNLWIGFIQAPDGSSGYDERGNAYWNNTLKTGNLLLEMAFYGDDTSVPRVINAVNYIDRHWNDPDYIGWRGPGPGGSPLWPACYQAMYCIMKGFEVESIQYISPLNNPSGKDWFQDFATTLLAQQNGDGSWPNAPLFGAPNGTPWAWDWDQILSTEWALLTLQKVAPPARPVIPDVPMGTIMASVSMITALLAYIGMKPLRSLRRRP